MKYKIATYAILGGILLLCCLPFSMGCTSNTMVLTAMVIDIGELGEYNALVTFDNGKALPISVNTLHWLSIDKTYHLQLTRGNGFTTPSNTWHIKDIEVVDTTSEPSQQ